jgi:hypothetical protein
MGIEKALFEPIRQYLETIVGCKANFTIKKNRSCPFGIFFTDPEIDYYRAREFSHQQSYKLHFSLFWKKAG